MNCTYCGMHIDEPYTNKPMFCDAYCYTAWCGGDASIFLELDEPSKCVCVPISR